MTQSCVPSEAQSVEPDTCCTGPFDVMLPWMHVWDTSLLGRTLRGHSQYAFGHMAARCKSMTA